VFRVGLTILVLFCYSLSGVTDEKEAASTNDKEEPKSTDTITKAEAEESPPPTRWGKIYRHPWIKSTGISSGVLLLLLCRLFILVARFFVCWPGLFGLFVLNQIAFYQEIHRDKTVPWQSITLNATACLTIWTVTGVTLLMVPNRFQDTSWKCFKWTHAVSFWLFWIPFESYYMGGFVLRWIGVPNPGITTNLYMFFLQPSILLYIYSGIVFDAVDGLRLCKHFWNFLDS